MKIEQRTVYVSPQAKTIEINARAIICQSVGNKSMSENELNDNDFETI